MQERIKEHDRDIRLACTQTSAVSEHANKTGHHPLWNKVKFIDRDSHWYVRRVKEAIHSLFFLPSRLGCFCEAAIGLNILEGYEF